MTWIKTFRFARLPDTRTEVPAQEDIDLCVENIGLMERHKRLRFGVIALAFSLLVAMLLLLLGAPQWTRLVLFIPLAVSAIGFNQARART